VTRIGQAASRLGDLLVAPFGDHAGWALAGASVGFGLAALLLFKVATPQRRLARERGQLVGRLYEAALYQTSLPVILRVQRGVLVANLRYLACALPAVAALVVPLVLVLPQLEARLGRRPLAVGEAALVAAALPGEVRATLTADRGVAVEAGPVRDAARGELVWRVRATAPGAHHLRLDAGGPALDLAVPVAVAGLPALTSARQRTALEQLLRDPAGTALPATSRVTRFAVALPPRDLRFAGVAVPWLVAFTVLSLAAGLLLRRSLRVEI